MTVLIHRRLRIQQKRDEIRDLLWRKSAVVPEARHQRARVLRLRVVDLVVHGLDGTRLQRVRPADRAAARRRSRLRGAEGIRDASFVEGEMAGQQDNPDPHSINNQAGPY